jgi:hypothetical protein
MLVASPCLAVPIGFGTFYISLTRGVSHCGLAIYIEKHHKAKEQYYGNSNISPCKNIIFRNSSKKKTKVLQDIITLELISSFNTSQNIILLSKILI